MHSHLRARFGFCNDHIWQLNAFKMVLMFQEVGLHAGSDAAYRVSVCWLQHQGLMGWAETWCSEETTHDRRLWDSVHHQ